MKWILALLLVCLSGCVWTCGGWRHPVYGCIEYEADREDCLLQISLKTGKDHRNCVYVYNPCCNGIVEKCMEDRGWKRVRR